MPATRTQKKKDLLTYASVTLSSGKSVGSANKKSELPTLKNQKQLNLLATDDELEPEIVASATNKESDNVTPMEEVVEKLYEDPTPMDITSTDQDSRLLAMRQKYKRVSSGLIKLKSHLDFIEKCKTKSSVPRGLCIKIKCNALLADFTNVGHRFEEIKNQAEGDFLEALTEHYELTTSKLESDRRILLATMDKFCKDCPNAQIVENHKTLLQKTDENILKHMKTLEEKKQKKTRGSE